MAKASLTPGVIELNDNTLPLTREDIRLDQLLPPGILQDRDKLKTFLEKYYEFLNIDEFIYQETETFTDVILDGVARFRIPDVQNENDRFFTDESGASSTLRVTSPTGNAPAEFFFNSTSAAVVDTANNKLIVGSANQKACPVGTQVVYDVGDGTAIGGLTNLFTYYVVSSSNGEIQLSTTDGGSAINLSSLGTGTIHSLKGPTDTMSIPLSDTNVAITNGNELPGTLADSTSEIGKTFGVNDLASFNGYSASLSTIVKYWVGPGPAHVINTMERAMDIDINASNYLELMQKEIAAAVPRDITANKRNLYKRMVDFYKLRGTSDSIEIFFRLLFNDSVEVEYPYDQTLIPSSGNWDQPARIDTTVNGAVTNSNTIVIASADENIRLSSKLVVGTTYTLTSDIRVEGINGTTITLSDPVTLTDGQEITFVPRGTYLDNKGQLSTTIKVQDSLRYQKFSYIIKTGKNLSDWEYVFDKLVHPAGFVYFAEILINLELTRSALGDNTKVSEIVSDIGYTGPGSEGKIPVEGKPGFLYRFLNQYTAIDRKTLTSMPGLQPGVIGPEDIPLLVLMFASTFLPGTEAKVHRTGTLSLSLKSGVLSQIVVTNPGSGYIAPPEVSSSDLGTPSVHVAATLTPVIANGGLTGVNIDEGGRDYDVPFVSIAAPLRISFDGSSTEVAGVGIVNPVDDTIKLTADQAAALPVGSKVTYDSGGGLAIGGLNTTAPNNEYYIVYNSNNEVKLSLTQGGSVVDITSAQGGTDHGFTGETATVTVSKTDGLLESITIVEPGYGYASAPTISFSGIEQSQGSGISPSVTIGIDSDGRLDQDNITINSSGGGWTALFATAAANPNEGSIASVDIFGLSDKTYSTAPSVIFPQPQAKDADGNPLSSNVLATAEFTLDSEGEITGVNITNAGSGYVDDPIVRLGSAVNNEKRVADQKEILILPLNHTDVDQIVTGIHTNPRQSSGSLRGHRLYDGLRLQDGVIGVVDSVTMDNTGSGYTEATVTFSGGGARSQATGTATISSGSIIGIVVTDGGDGYTSAPTITITGDGSNASATAIVDLNYTITEQTPVADKFLPEHNVDIVNPAFRTIVNNGYIQRKGTNNLYDTPRLYHSNQTIAFLGDKEIQTLDNTDINKYNVRSFVHIE